MNDLDTKRGAGKVSGATPETTGGTPVPPVDLLGRLPWLRRLPTVGDMKALRMEATWNPAAGEKLKEMIARIEELRRVAKEDGHDVVNPAFVAERNGEIIGYCSMEPVLMAVCWMHTKRSGRRDSMAMLNQVENETSRMGYGQQVMPCAKDSPFYGALEKLGYVKREVFMKNLRSMW